MRFVLLLAELFFQRACESSASVFTLGHCPISGDPAVCVASRRLNIQCLSNGTAHVPLDKHFLLRPFWLKAFLFELVLVGCQFSGFRGCWSGPSQSRRVARPASPAKQEFALKVFMLENTIRAVTERVKKFSQIRCHCKQFPCPSFSDFVHFALFATAPVVHKNATLLAESNASNTKKNTSEDDAD